MIIEIYSFLLNFEHKENKLANPTTNIATSNTTTNYSNFIITYNFIPTPTASYLNLQLHTYTYNFLPIPTTSYLHLQLHTYTYNFLPTTSYLHLQLPT